jgi:lipoprotein-anchoring transpeptidase ErfK/SrfK
MMRNASAAVILGAGLILAACSDPSPKPAATPVAQAAPAPAPQAGQPSVTEPLQVVQVNDPVSLAALPTPEPAAAAPAATAINEARWPAGAGAQAKSAALTRAEVLLARARFSPGVIDGQDGGNLKNAISAFQEAHGLPVDGKMSADVFAALTGADPGPVVVTYVITAQDAAGPFVAAIPKEYPEMAKLERLSFTTPLEALGEKFHMDEALLKTLNPGADFGATGTQILVAAAGPETLPAPVAAIEVDKTAGQVRAYGGDGLLLASYPATVGSTERPAPVGAYKVKGVARNPTYTYDPTRLTYGDKSMGKVVVQPGPNNPVGVAWIDLSIPTYGIHGAPDPRLVGKTASHGCVRLTNWDVRQLSSAVKPGTTVTFVGTERITHPKLKLNSASARSQPRPG